MVMKRILVLALSISAATASAGVREAAVAGSFYPDDPKVLRTQIEGMLGQARDSAQGFPSRALIVPHAGYVFSGRLAAGAFATLPTSAFKRGRAR